MKIYTLGNFDIQIDNESLMNELGYAYKTIRLFKYFLTFNEKRLLPENMIDDLWSDNESTDPKNILRTQISRVRNMIKIEGEADKQLYSINHINGYYVFEINCDYKMDVEIFESKVMEGIRLKENNPEKALILLKEGLKLYKGEYLQEMEYEDWLIPIRNRYKRLYLEGVLSLIEILKEKDENKKIVEICEKAIYHDPYSEELNIGFIEALLAMGEKRYAIDHYEYITSRIYNELQIPPSEKMESIYKKIHKKEDQHRETITLKNLESELDSIYDKERPIFYEPENFKLIYYLESRKKDRAGKRNDFLFIITIYDKRYKKISKEDMEKSMLALINVTYKDFRKGDIISKWNENQIVCLLYNVEGKGLDIITERLNEKYKRQIENDNIVLNIMFKEI